MVENEKIADLTKLLLKEIGEDPNREGLIKSPSRVSKAWSFFSRGYNQDVNELPKLHRDHGGGMARNGSGLVYENLIKRTCSALELDAKKNDYKRTEEVNGHCLKNLQVDWHVYKNNKMVKAIESKTYLDACYLKRAVMDII